MRTPGTTTRWASAAGFTVLEMSVALGVTLAVMGATFAAMTQASQISESASQVTTVNNNLRSAMDVFVRDLTQAGQGLPGFRRAGVPNGVNAEPILRPFGELEFRPQNSLPAISVGQGLGANGSDIITALLVDPTLDDLTVTAASASASSATVTVVNTRPLAITNGGAYNVKAGDLMLVRNGGGDVLMSVTTIAGQQITFSADDDLGLNQFGATVTGSATNVIGASPTLTGVRVSRVRMITYYLEQTDEDDPRQPRLMRRVNMGTPATVGFAVQNFTLTYDLAAENVRFTGVAMNEADVVDGDGACQEDEDEDEDDEDERVCSENWIRKVNVVMSARATMPGPSGGYYANSLFAQVGIRSLAFRDRY